MNDKKKLAQIGGAVVGGAIGYTIGMKAPFVFVATLGIAALAVGIGFVGGMAGELTCDIIAEAKA